MVTPAVRLSRQLLQIMHDAQSMNIRSQTFAHTMVLLHALKVAHFSVPQYLDHQEEVDEP